MFKRQFLNLNAVKFIAIFSCFFVMAFLVAPLLLISLISYYLYFTNLKPILKYSLISFNTLLGLFFTVLYYLALWENWISGTEY